MKKISLILGILMLLGFCFIIWATDSVGVFFGKTGEIIALVVVAIVLFIGLIKTRGDK